MTERVDQGERIPFRHSIQLKFALTYIIIIAAVLILLNTYPVLVSQDLVFRSKTSLLQSQASVIADTIARTESLTSEAVRDYVEPLGYTGQFRVLVTDEFGLILYDSDDLRATEGRYAMLSEVVAALRGYDVAASEYREAAFHSRAAVPVIYRDLTIGCVYIYEYDTEQAQLLLDIQQNLRSISLVVCVVVLLMSIVFSKALTRRIAALLGADSLGYLSVESAHKLANGCRCTFCDGCFTGHYPIPVPEAREKYRFERRLSQTSAGSSKNRGGHP